MRHAHPFAALTAAALAALILTAPALAVSIHFVSASAALSGPSLVVSWKEAGLGDNALIGYTASANATVEYACINGGGNHPQAANKEFVSGPVSASGQFSSGKNGNITGSLTLTPPGPAGFSCPSGQRLTVPYVSYSNVQLWDTTDGIRATQLPSGPYTFGSRI